MQLQFGSQLKDRGLERLIELIRNKLDQPKGLEKMIREGLQLPPGMDMPFTRKVESYPLGDYLYDRSRAADEVKKHQLSWLWYLYRQQPDVIEACGKIARLFKRTPDAKFS
jgi:hypothetical protein